MNNDAVETTLEQVDSQRRGFLRELLAGGAAVAVLPAMTTVALSAPEDQQGQGKGKGGKGKGEGKGKGPGGKGKGEGGPPDPARMAAMMIRNFDKDGDKALNEKELVAALTEMAKRRAAGKGKGEGKGKGDGKGKGKGGKGKGKGQAGAAGAK